MEENQKHLAFRHKVKAEAKAQRDLRAAGKPVPAELKRYARRSGLVMVLAPALGLVVLWFVAKSSGFISVGVSLFFTFFMLVGIAQVITGRHFLAGR